MADLGLAFSLGVSAPACKAVYAGTVSDPVDRGESGVFKLAETPMDAAARIPQRGKRGRI
jgi:hypothetical protein